MKFSKPVPSGSTLSLKVVKETKDGRTVESLPVKVSVSYTPTPLLVGTSTVTNDKLTIAGENLTDPSVRVILNRSAPSISSYLVAEAKAAADGKSVVIDLRKERLQAGCYAGALTASGIAYPVPAFSISPPASMTKATRAGNSVTLEGRDLVGVDSGSCKLPITFKVVEVKNGSMAQGVTNLKLEANGAKASFDFQFPTGESGWKVQVFSGSADSPVSEVTIDKAP